MEGVMQAAKAETALDCAALLRGINDVRDIPGLRAAADMLESLHAVLGTPAMDRERLLARLEGENRLLRQALAEVAAPPPGTKGMSPPDRAQRLFAELDRRALLARRACHGS
jgi:hypothetical protein